MEPRIFDTACGQLDPDELRCYRYFQLLEFQILKLLCCSPGSLLSSLTGTTMARSAMEPYRWLNSKKKGVQFINKISLIKRKEKCEGKNEANMMLYYEDFNRWNFSLKKEFLQIILISESFVCQRIPENGT